MTLEYKSPYKITENILKLISEISEYVGQYSVTSDFLSTPKLRKGNRVRTINYFKEKGLLMCLVSGANHDYVESSVSKHDLMKHFEFIVGGDDVKKSKPAPDVYLKALEILNLGKDECIVLEDTSSGIMAAASAGLQCIGIKSKYSETQDFSRSTVTVKSLKEAKNWIAENYLL